MFLGSRLLTVEQHDNFKTVVIYEFNLREYQLFCKAYFAAMCSRKIIHFETL